MAKPSKNEIIDNQSKNISQLIDDERLIYNKTKKNPSIKKINVSSKSVNKRYKSEVTNSKPRIIKTTNPNETCRKHYSYNKLSMDMKKNAAEIIENNAKEEQTTISDRNNTNLQKKRSSSEANMRKFNPNNLKLEKIYHKKHNLNNLFERNKSINTSLEATKASLYNPNSTKNNFYYTQSFLCDHTPEELNLESNKYYFQKQIENFSLKKMKVPESMSFNQKANYYKSFIKGQQKSSLYQTIKKTIDSQTKGEQSARMSPATSNKKHKSKKVQIYYKPKKHSQIKSSYRGKFDSHSRRSSTSKKTSTNKKKYIKENLNSTNNIAKREQGLQNLVGYNTKKPSLESLKDITKTEQKLENGQSPMNKISQRSPATSQRTLSSTTLKYQMIKTHPNLKKQIQSRSKVNFDFMQNNSGNFPSSLPYLTSRKLISNDTPKSDFYMVIKKDKPQKCSYAKVREFKLNDKNPEESMEVAQHTGIIEKSEQLEESSMAKENLPENMIFKHSGFSYDEIEPIEEINADFETTNYGNFYRKPSSDKGLIIEELEKVTSIKKPPSKSEIYQMYRNKQSLKLIENKS